MARRRTLLGPSSPAGGSEAVDKLHLCSILPPGQAAPFAMQQDAHRNSREKDFAGELFVRQYLMGEGGIRPVPKKESQMAWKAPKIIEVPVGMEINMYACAARK
jgi:coenzyme PQQ precursor peptide PqqA